MMYEIRTINYSNLSETSTINLHFLFLTTHSNVKTMQDLTFQPPKQRSAQAQKYWLKPVFLVAIMLMAAGFPSVTSAGVWSISMDNDLFVPFTSTDHDFTGGFAVTYTSKEGPQQWRKLDSALATLDRFTRLNQSSSTKPSAASIELGFYGFTPEDKTRSDVIWDDRPYSSLSYLSMSRMYPANLQGNYWSSSLTLGVLGLDIFGEAQNAIHRTVNVDESSGWGHQISSGGELTARYQVAYHDHWASSTSSSRFKTTYFSSLGYITEAGVSLSTRFGRISSPDQRFNPELITYGERVNELAAAGSYGMESYFWGGVALKARAYNAFLQGQFRDSEHSLSSSELRPVIAEAWVGYTFGMGQNRSLSYFIKAQSSEIRSGKGDRGHVWGGLVLSLGF